MFPWTNSPFTGIDRPAREGSDCPWQGFLPPFPWHWEGFHHFLWKDWLP